MKRIGTTSSGNYIIEATPEEWRDYLIQGIDFDPKTLVSEIQAYREQTGMTQSRLAEIIGVSRNYISLIERGLATNLSLSVYQRILEAIS